MKKIKRETLIIAIIIISFITMLLLSLVFCHEYAAKQITALKIDKQAVYEKMMEYEAELGENYKHIASLNEAIAVEQSENARLHDELEVLAATVSDLKNSEYELIYIGDYKLTHYCTEQRAHICGTGTGLTATGTQVTAGWTIAVDPSIIPYGTEVYIEGYGWRVAEDCGGAVKGKHIDIAVETHSQASSMGTTTGGVWILVKKSS